MKNTKKIVCALLALIMVLTCFTPLQADRVSAKSSKLNKTQATLYPGDSLKSKLTKATSETIREFYCDDMNGDGEKEAVGITSKTIGEFGYFDAKVWYITDKKCSLIVECKGWDLYPETVRFYKLKGTRMLTFDAGAGGSGWITYLYTFDKNGAKEVKNAMAGISYMGNNNFMVYDSRYDALIDGTGHTWNTYYSKWDGDKLVEYGGIKISQAQLKKAKNGEKILKEIKKKGKIGTIYYRANNLIFVNYTTTDANYNVTLKLKNKKASYYSENEEVNLEKATNPGIIYKSITSCVQYPKKFPLDAASTSASKKSKLSDTQYKKVQGWWTENSSGGWDVKFTRSTVKYYDRATGKVAWKATIEKCKKKDGIYIYYIKSKNGKYEFRTTDADPDVLEYYMSWDDKNIGNYYSGSSSLSRGKWGN